jgi:hypothetical protein
MTVGDFLKEALERKYVGKSIKKPYEDGTFVVAHVEVRDGGVDPQWEIGLYSELNRQMNEESRAWQLANNPKGGVLAPKELEDRWRVGWAEAQYFTLVDQVLPEVSEPTLSGLTFGGSMICVSGSYAITNPTNAKITLDEAEHEEELDLANCEQCDEPAWDGYICHACGMKNI